MRDWGVDNFGNYPLAVGSEGGVYCDTRLGGEPRYFLADQCEPLMNIPDEIRQCVVFLGYKKPDGSRSLAGTAFFVSRPTPYPEYTFSYLITAKHVIDNIRDRCCTEVCLRMNHAKLEQAVWVDTPISGWIFHPDDDDECDVAIFGCSLSFDFSHRALPEATFATAEVIKTRGVGVGSEIFLAGLFASHHGQRQNIPIIRVGNISAMAGEEKVETRYGLIDAYLVEARSLGGISGSPVFVRVQALRAIPTEDSKGARIANVDEYHLLGLMHGHWDVDYQTETSADTLEDATTGVRSVNMGIAIVVPASKILEVLTQPMVKKNEKELVERERQQRNLPKPDTALDDEEVSFTRQGFEDVLRRASRKVSETKDSDKKE